MLVTMTIRFRRKLLFPVLVAGFLAVGHSLPSLARSPEETGAETKPAAHGWSRVPGILGRITAPVFPEREFLITKFGAVGDGTHDCSPAFHDAIEACHQAGGGKVVVPAGRFLTGPIHLKSRVNLNVTKNATILFSTDPKQFLPVVFSRDVAEMMNYSPFIYAFEQDNIAVTGE